MFLSFTILVSGAFALSIDFTDGSIWGGASGNQAYSHYYSELDLDVTLLSYQSIGGSNVTPGGVLTWNAHDGIGINLDYEYDEIEGLERLFVIFSKGVYYFWYSFN